MIPPTHTRRFRFWLWRRDQRRKMENRWCRAWQWVAGRSINAGHAPYRKRDVPLTPLPADEQTEFLVNGSCEHCDWRCACPEGWLWPLCPRCGGHVKPRRAEAFSGFGDSKGYIAVVKPEGDAYEEVRKAA